MKSNPAQKSTLKGRLGFAVLFVYLAAGTSARADEVVIYVDANASSEFSDGQTWCTAYKYLQDGLAAARQLVTPPHFPPTIVTIKVAGGVYRPDLGHSLIEGDRQLYFELLNPVSLIGGFAGCGHDNPDEQDRQKFETILSGDGPDPNSDLDNSLHVIGGRQLGSLNVVDGFTIKGGRAIPSSDLQCNPCDPRIDSCIPCDKGGGLFAIDSRFTVRFCTFYSDEALAGGAQLYFSGRAESVNSTIVEHCLFEETTIPTTPSRAIGLEDTSVSFFYSSFTGFSEGVIESRGSVLDLLGGQFRMNHSYYTEGGAILLHSGVLRAKGSQFVGNSGTNFGGAIYGNVGTRIEVSGSTFDRNQVGIEGSAIWSWQYSSLLVDSCTFTMNRTGLGELYGGAVVSRGGDIDVRRSKFLGNDGALADRDSGGTAVTVEQSVFVGTGQPIVEFESNPLGAQLSNNTFVGYLGAAIQGVVRNSIFVGNIPPGVFVEYSMHAGPSSNCTGCIVGSPQFRAAPDSGPDGVWGTDDDFYGDLGLMEGSLGIDAGSNDAIQDTWDIEGKPRFLDDPASPNAGVGIGPIVDMGAYEFAPDCNGNGIEDYVDIGQDPANLDCNYNTILDSCERCDALCEPLVNPISSRWIGPFNSNQGTWGDESAWCPPLVPDNIGGPKFNVSVVEPGSVVLVDHSRTISALTVGNGDGLGDAAIVHATEDTGPNSLALIVEGPDGIRNDGRIEVFGDRKLQLESDKISQGEPCNAGGLLAAGNAVSRGTLEINRAKVTGGRVQIGTDSEVRLIGGAELHNVCIEGSGVVLDSENLLVPNSQNGAFRGTITNKVQALVKGETASTTLAPTASDPADAKLEGTGSVRLLHRPYSKLGDIKVAFTNGPSHTILGAGIVLGGMVNDGTVSADTLGEELVISAPGRKENHNLMEARNGGILRIADDLEGNGNLRAEGGTIRILPTEGPTIVSTTNLDVGGASISKRQGRVTIGNRVRLVAEHLDLNADGTLGADPPTQSDQDGDASVVAGDLSIAWSYSDDTPGGGMSLTGQMSARVTASLSLGDKGGGTRPPCLRVYDDAVVVAGGTLYVAQAADITYRSSVALALGGSFENHSQNAPHFDWLNGAMTLTGPEEQDFEVAGVDLGPSLEGFSVANESSCYGRNSNFAMGTLELASSSSVNFKNDLPNSANPGATEALYVRTLILQPGSKLTIDDGVDGAYVYYINLVGSCLPEMGCDPDRIRRIPCSGGPELCFPRTTDCPLDACLTDPGKPAKAGCGVYDRDADSDVDLFDLALAAERSLSECLRGPDLPVAKGACRVYDMDNDADVDLHDVALMQRR